MADMAEHDQDAAYRLDHERMVEKLRASYRIADERVLAAMTAVCRHRFIPKPYRGLFAPYGDHPGPIGYEQTISQPYIVAYMTDKLGLREGEKVLEIGTGSGYQTAVLAAMGVKVFSIEIVPALVDHLKTVLVAEGYADKVEIKLGDGYAGWPEHAPFDAVIVTCAPENIPEALVSQLREGGRMILPVGSYQQRLIYLRKEQGRINKIDDIAVRFVPMVHGA